MMDPLATLRLSSARSALGSGDPATASEWLAGVGASAKPADLVAAVEYGMAKLALGEQRWAEAARRLAIASQIRVGPWPKWLATHRRPGVETDCGAIQAVPDEADPSV